MPRSVIFQGVELTWPDAYSALDLSRLLTPSSGGVGIVALVGEADGGKPGMTLIPGGASSTVVKDMFKSGPLANMARMALRSGIDPDVPNGASALLCFKTNNSTQSTLPVSGVHPAFTLTTKQYGEFTKYFTGEIATVSGLKYLTIRDKNLVPGSPSVETSVGVGGIQYATLKYNGDSTTALMSLKYDGAHKLMLTVTLAGDQTDGSLNLSLDVTSMNLFQLKSALDLILNDSDAIVYTLTVPVQYQQTMLVNLDYVTSDISVKTTAYGFLASISELSDWVSTTSKLLGSLARGTENYGSTVPGSLSATQFSGGTRGTSTNTDVQNGFNALLEFRVNIVVPLFSSDNQDGSTVTLASVNSICRDHVQARSSLLGRSECQSYVSIKGDKEDFLAECARMNSRYVSVTSQSVTDVDINGDTVVYPEYAFAVVCAQTQAGSPIGTPLTYKALPVSGLTQNVSWSPIVDGVELIKAGALIAAADENNVMRIVNGYTSYLTDDNNGNILIETVESFAVFSFNHRKFMKQKFLGKKDFSANSVLDAIKESLKAEKEINKTIKDYDEKLINLTSVGSDLRYEVPAQGWEGVNFILPTVIGIRV
jgi:hypothetical protein